MSWHFPGHDVRIPYRSLTLGREMFRGVYTERSECAPHDRAVTPTDIRIILFISIIVPSLHLSRINQPLLH